jgi:hypothetical protein
VGGWKDNKEKTMTLTKETYTVTKDTMQKVLDILSDYSVSESGYRNNDDVIEVSDALQTEVYEQDPVEDQL